MGANGDQRVSEPGGQIGDIPRPYTLTIQRLANGYTVQDSEGQTAVVQEPDDPSLDDNTLSARGFVDLAELLCEWLGCEGSRHDAERVWIELKPGDKYEEGAGKADHPAKAKRGRRDRERG